MPNNPIQAARGLSHHLPEKSVPLRDTTEGEALRDSVSCFPTRKAIAWLAEGKAWLMTYQ